MLEVRFEHFHPSFEVFRCHGLEQEPLILCEEHESATFAHTLSRIFNLFLISLHIERLLKMFLTEAVDGPELREYIWSVLGAPNFLIEYLILALRILSLYGVDLELVLALEVKIRIRMWIIYLL
mgnify:CR=1 FL=1